MSGRTNFGAFLDVLAHKISEEQKAESDFKGNDGLLYCGICKRPKQSIVTWYDGTKKLVPIACKCSKDLQKKKAEGWRWGVGELWKTRSRSVKDVAVQHFPYILCRHALAP
jgi:hypothetical protein